MSATPYEVYDRRDAQAPLPLHLLTSDATELVGWLGSQERIYSSLGDRLPPVVFSSMAFDWYCEQAKIESEPLMQPQLLESTVVSTVTGCWLPKPPKPDENSPGRYRTPGGYITAGDKYAQVSPSGSTTRHRATNQRHELAKGGDPLRPEIQVDHICRNTACYCPFHVRRMDNQQNNELKNLARRFELALVANQLFMCMDTGWVDELMKEGEPIVATRYGAFLIERLEENILVGTLQPDPVREALRRPAPYRHRRHRAEVSVGQSSIELSLYDVLLSQVAQLGSTAKVA